MMRLPRHPCCRVIDINETTILYHRACYYRELALRSPPLVFSDVPSVLLFFDAAIPPDGAETLESTVAAG